MCLCLTMWYTHPSWLPVLAAVSSHPSDRYTGWHSHIAPPEGTNHQDSDTLQQNRIYSMSSRVHMIQFSMQCSVQKTHWPASALPCSSTDLHIEWGLEKSRTNTYTLKNVHYFIRTGFSADSLWILKCLSDVQLLETQKLWCWKKA